MRLAELDPRWFDFNGTSRAGFVFLCPCCHGVPRRPDVGPTYLLCKRVRMQVVSDQAMTIEAAFPDIDVSEMVPARKDFCWAIAGEFANLSVTPSIDASASGHWHGFIINGEIR